jgi:hypothetical protein
MRLVKSSGKWLAVTLACAGVFLTATGIYLRYYRGNEVVIHLRTVEPRLTEIDLVNQSASDQDLDRGISVSWDSGDLLGAGGLAGFDRTDAGAHALVFKPRAASRPAALQPREVRAIGWFRLSGDSPLHTEFAPPP